MWTKEHFSTSQTFPSRLETCMEWTPEQSAASRQGRTGCGMQVFYSHEAISVLQSVRPPRGSIQQFFASMPVTRSSLDLVVWPVTPLLVTVFGGRLPPPAGRFVYGSESRRPPPPVGSVDQRPDFRKKSILLKIRILKICRTSRSAAP